MHTSLGTDGLRTWHSCETASSKCAPSGHQRNSGSMDTPTNTRRVITHPHHWLRHMYNYYMCLSFVWTSLC